MRLEVDPDDLKPLVALVAAELLERMPVDDATLAYAEADAARLVGVEPHVLRDARLRGEVEGSKVGRSVVYQRVELLRFLAARRWRRK